MERGFVRTWDWMWWRLWQVPNYGGVPPNTRGIEQSYSKHKMICWKKKLASIESMENPFFMAMLNLPVKYALHDKDEFL